MMQFHEGLWDNSCFFLLRYFCLCWHPIQITRVLIRKVGAHIIFPEPDLWRILVTGLSSLCANRACDRNVCARLICALFFSLPSCVCPLHFLHIGGIPTAISYCHLHHVSWFRDCQKAPLLPKLPTHSTRHLMCINLALEYVPGKQKSNALQKST